VGTSAERRSDSNVATLNHSRHRGSARTQLQSRVPSATTQVDWSPRNGRVKFLTVFFGAASPRQIPEQHRKKISAAYR
jgi:hypothetical protein